MYMDAQISYKHSLKTLKGQIQLGKCGIRTLDPKKPIKMLTVNWNGKNLATNSSWDFDANFETSDPS